jgi:protein phosphatase
MVDAGLITEEQALRHPLRNVVTRSLGTETMPTPDLWVFPPHPGERFVICSDGLSNELSLQDIRRVVLEVEEPQQAAEALVRAAVDAGGRDNVTAIVVALDGGDDEDFDADTAPRSGPGDQRD